MRDVVDGLIMCSRYAFAPNYYHYCGPQKQNDLFGYVREAEGDTGLAEILNRFETLYPYLVLIASENHLKDPFDPRVVEAYWLGNRLLTNVKEKVLAAHLLDGLGLKKKLPKKKLTPTLDAVASGGVPQHNFHVMNIYVRTGHMAVPHTLSTMDNCRISWGRVVQGASDPASPRLRGASKGQGTSKTGVGMQYVIETRPLEYVNNVIQLGLPERKIVTSVTVAPKVGDWVSVHWGFVCDVINDAQRRNLARFTDLAMIYANKSRILG